MSLFEAFRLAIKSLSLHKLRSILTTLGIIFGVGSVISMLAISEGAKRETLSQIESLGTNNIIFRSAPPVTSQTVNTGRRSIMAYGLVEKDLDHLRALCPTATAAVPLRNLRMNIFRRGKKVDVAVYATAPEYLAAGNLIVAEGRFITPLDERAWNQVCVLGVDARRELFANRDAVGQTMKIGNHYFQVVGVMSDRSRSGALQGRDVNRDIYIPFETFRKRFGTTTVTRESGKFESVDIEADEAILMFADPDAVSTAAPIVRRAVERAHGRKDVGIVVPLELLEQRKSAQRVFQIVMLSIAAISLLVGGIGIMNIMLASVVERTKEIGTRRALGARKSDIVIQFLIEAVALALIGGILGIGAGLGIASLIAGVAGWPMVTTWVSILSAFVISSAAGVIFGTYPALIAARLDPILSLRSE